MSFSKDILALKHLKCQEN